MAVQTETYANIVARVEALMGDSFTTKELTRLKALINRRARYAYKLYDSWPSFYRANVARRLQANNGIEHVHLDVNGADFGADQIDEVLRVWQKEPFSDTGSQEVLDAYTDNAITYPVDADLIYSTVTGFTFGVGTTTNLSVTNTLLPHGLKVGDKVQIANSEDGLGNALSRFNIAATVAVVSSTTSFIIAGDFSSSAAYVEGDLQVPQVYLAYRKRIAGTYGDGAGETTTVPHELAEYLVQGAYADALRADGQTDKAKAEEGIAHEILQQEMLRHDRIQTRHDVTTKLRTHGTEACR